MVSVSVVARLTVRASWRSFSSMWSVFFIRMILPYHSIRSNRIARPECRPLHASAIITIDETTWRLRIADSGQVGPVALTASTNENPKFLPA